MPQIKEFFNTKIKKNQRVKGRRKVGTRGYIENNIEIPSIHNFKAFINCNISPSICPMLWDELKDVQEGVRYCIYCEKNVYEVSNIKDYEQHLSKNECMSIPYSLIENNNEEIEFSNILKNDLTDILKLSRFFIVAKYLNSYGSEFISSANSKELFLKNIISALIFNRDFEVELEKYLSHGVDMEFIFTEVCTRIEDKKFVDLVNKQIIEKEKWKNDNKLNEIKQIINESEAILITAGSRMGIDSELVDVRGDERFWSIFRISRKSKLRFRGIVNPKWFVSNPFVAWAFYGYRYNLYKNTIPHNGFKILLDLVKEKNDNYFILTSNVDGPFQKAGFDEDKIVECHGSISHFQCINDCKEEIWKSDIEKIDVDMEDFLTIDIPLCPECRGIARPNILMFGDVKWNNKRTLNQEIRYSKWKNKNKNKKLLVIELDAGSAISSVRRESENIAKYYNGKLLRINPREYDFDFRYGYSIRFEELEGLKVIL